MGDDSDIDAALESLEPGDPDALRRLLTTCYERLRRVTRSIQGGRTGEATSVVHDLFAKLLTNEKSTAKTLKFEGPGQLFSFFSLSLRRTIVDRARARNAQRRGGGRLLLSLHDTDVLDADRPIDLFELHDELERLRALDPRLWQVAENKLFGGLTTQQIADALDLSTSTIEVEWRKARTWLAHRLSRDTP